MRKFLLMILSLMACLSFIVSCDKNVFSSNKETISSSAVDDSDKKPVIDEEYTTYHIEIEDTDLLQEIKKDSSEIERQHWIFKDFNDFCEFEEKLVQTKIDEITVETFEENVVYLFLYRHEANNKVKYGNINVCANYTTTDMKGYIMLAEKNVCYTSINSGASLPYVLDLVLVPKSKVDVDNIAYIDLIYYVNYSYDFKDDTGTFLEYIPYTPVLSNEMVIEPSPSEKWEYVEGIITPGYFDSYTIYSGKDGYFHVSEDNGTIISSYQELLKWLPDEKKILDVVTEQTFDENFIVLLFVDDFMREEQDIYYTNFTKENDYYTLTQNIVSSNLYSKPDENKGISFCVIPRSECIEDLSTIEIKIIEKEYQFARDKYKSSCMVMTRVQSNQ